MRTLLLASQERGVGQTSTALNFAAAGGLSGSKTLLVAADPQSDLVAELRLEKHGDQASLNDIGVADFGRLYRGVLPNLDVLCPYEAGHTAPEHLEQVLIKLKHAYFEKYAWCLLDAPPLGEAGAPALLKATDELIFVCRVGPEMPDRLAAYQGFMQATEAGAGQALVRGVLLTRLAADAADDHENEARQALGRKALPLSIPYDQAVSQAARGGRPVVMVDPGSPAAQMLKELAEALGVARTGSAILKAPPKPGSGSTPKAEPVRAPKPPSAPRSEPKLDLAGNPAKPAPMARKNYAPNVSGEFKIDAQTLDRMLGLEQKREAEEAAPRPIAPIAPMKPPPARRNEARSFLDLDPMEGPASGLEDRPSGRVPQLEEHLNAYRPAPRQVPSARVPAPPPPAQKPASRPSSAAQLSMRISPTAPAPSAGSSSGVWWLVGILLVVAGGVGVGMAGMKAAETGNLQIFLALTLGLGVTGLVFIIGMFAGRRPN